MSTYRHPQPDQTVTLKGSHVTNGGQIGIRVSNVSSDQLLSDVLIQLRMSNLYNAINSDINIQETEVDG